MSDTNKPDDPGVPSIRVPKAVDESLNAPPQRANFSEQGMTGAQIFANLLPSLYPPGLGFSPEPGIGAIKH
jgi:hypothetical protein